MPVFKFSLGGYLPGEYLQRRGGVVSCIRCIHVCEKREARGWWLVNYSRQRAISDGTGSIVRRPDTHVTSSTVTAVA